MVATFDDLWRLADELRDVIPIFTLTEVERRDIVSHMRLRRFDEHEVVYHQGDPGDDLFVVHEGLVISLREDGEGRRLLLSFAGRGQFFGELELFTSSHGRTTTVTAVKQTVALQIPRAQAAAVLERNPKAMLYMGRRQFELSRRYLDLASDLAFGDAERRVAFVLLELEQLRDRTALSMTQEEIGAAAGVTDRTVRRVIASLVKRGLVRSGNDGVRIVDEGALRRKIPGVDGAAGAPSRLGDVVIAES
jgi:CRP/FNR family transcriptional regulator, cyclic AMP receptor protein